jgi:hypothetical protein
MLSSRCDGWLTFYARRAEQLTAVEPPEAGMGAPHRMAGHGSRTAGERVRHEPPHDGSSRRAIRRMTERTF